MKTAITSVLCLCIGLLLGWHLRAISPTAPVESEIPGTVSSAMTAPEDKGKSALVPFKAAYEPDGRDFEQLLAADFAAAANRYDAAIASGLTSARQWKPLLVAALRSCMHSCSEAIFLERVDSWLANHYEDTEVLLILAEHQAASGYANEAAKTLQYARTYAYSETDSAAVALQLRQLVHRTDSQLLAAGAIAELTGFYELLDSIGMTSPGFQLRRAELYRALGETGNYQSLIHTLELEDDRTNPDWTARLAAHSQTTSTQPQEAAASAATAIELTRAGEHYLVSASLNGDADLALLIDTGASITTLASASFATLDQAGLVYLGSRLFNTAGGVTRGSVYRAESLTLGGIEQREVELAVLDYPTGAGVDGLLGMNVLRHYRFEIDQDRGVLLIRAR